MSIPTTRVFTRAIGGATAVVLCVAHVCAQTSRDAWDAQFNPGALRNREERRNANWIESFRGRLCTAADIKAYWSFALKKAVPGVLDPQYQAVIQHNAELEYLLASGQMDAEAQDAADQFNIIKYQEEGRESEAAALEKVRLKRARIAEQRQLQEIMAAEQARLVEEMIDEMRKLRRDVNRARRTR